MNIQDEAREKLTQKRQEQEALHKKTLERSDQYLKEGEAEQESLRELMTQDRLDEEKKQANMLERLIE
jgi:hypothetical protein